MVGWLPAVLLAASLAAHVQANSAQPLETPTAPSFRLRAIPQFNSRSLAQDGMIAQEELGPNAHVGLGLAPMLGRNIHSVLLERELVPTRNPGVTFVLKFPR